MSDLENLVSMGFDEKHAEAALAATKGAGLEQAINWIIDHPQPAEGEAPSASADPADDSEKPSEEDGSMALKCEDCGKILSTSAKAEFHAVKTGHQNFSQTTEGVRTTPMTEEEKKQKLKELEVRIKARKAAKAHEEEQEAFEKEKNRIQSGKNMTEIKKKHEEAEMKKLAEERKRQKLADKAAKERVMKMIEEDKEKRRLASLKKASPGEAASPATPAAVTPAATAAKKTYDECRIQFRFPSGPLATQTFKAKEPLSAVHCWLAVNRPAPSPHSAITLSTSYPKRVFTQEEMQMPLDSLDLVPSASLMVHYKLSNV